MLSQEVAIGNQTSIDVVMKEDIQGLEEVVVVGYGIQKKLNLTGAVEQVTSETLENRPVSNVQQAIQGVLPSMKLFSRKYRRRAWFINGHEYSGSRLLGWN